MLAEVDAGGNALSEQPMAAEVEPDAWRLQRAVVVGAAETRLNEQRIVDRKVPSESRIDLADTVAGGGEVAADMYAGTQNRVGQIVVKMRNEGAEIELSAEDHAGFVFRLDGEDGSEPHLVEDSREAGARSGTGIILRKGG